MSPDAPEGSPPLVELLGQVQWMLREAESEEQIFDAENCPGPLGAAHAPVAFPTVGQFLRGGFWAQPPKTAVSGPAQSRSRRWRLPPPSRPPSRWSSSCPRRRWRAPGLTLSQSRSLAPGDSSVIASQSPVVTSNLLAFPMHKMGLNHTGDPRHAPAARSTAARRPSSASSRPRSPPQGPSFPSETV